MWARRMTQSATAGEYASFGVVLGSGVMETAMEGPAGAGRSWIEMVTVAGVTARNFFTA